MFFLLNNEGTSAHCEIIPCAMFCFSTLGSPRWVPLTLIIFKLKVQEKSQIKGAYSLQCSQKQNRSLPNGVEVSRQISGTQCFLTPAQQCDSLGSLGEVALPLVSLTWVSPMVVDKPDWIIIFYKLPKQNGLRAGNPHKSGQFTLNLKHFLCLPGALTSLLTSPHLSYLSSPLLFIWDKKVVSQMFVENVVKLVGPL